MRTRAPILLRTSRAPCLDSLATIRRSPGSGDRPEASSVPAYPSNPTSAKPGEDLGGGRHLATRCLPQARIDGRMKSHALGGIQIVTFVIDHEIENRSFR